MIPPGYLSQAKLAQLLQIRPVTASDSDAVGRQSDVGPKKKLTRCKGGDPGRTRTLSLLIRSQDQDE